MIHIAAKTHENAAAQARRLGLEDNQWVWNEPGFKLTGQNFTMHTADDTPDFIAGLMMAMGASNTNYTGSK
jgi:hypothetical protein